jgi:hypothetical protein
VCSPIRVPCVLFRVPSGTNCILLLTSYPIRCELPLDANDRPMNSFAWHLHKEAASEPHCIHRTPSRQFSGKRPLPDWASLTSPTPTNPSCDGWTDTTPCFFAGLQDLVIVKLGFSNLTDSGFAYDLGFLTNLTQAFPTDYTPFVCAEASLSVCQSVTVSPVTCVFLSLTARPKRKPRRCISLNRTPPSAKRWAGVFRHLLDCESRVAQRNGFRGCKA